MFRCICALAVALLLLLLLALRNLAKKEPPLACIPLSAAVPCMKSGDVLAYGQSGKRGRIVKMFTGTVWVHTAILWRHRGELFVLEMSRYERKGLFLIHLKTWIQLHHFRPIVWLSVGADVACAELRRALQLGPVEIDEFVPGVWVKTWLKTPPRPLTHFSCVALTVHVLQRLGLIETRCSADSYAPWDLIYAKVPWTVPVHAPILLDPAF